MLCLTLLVSPKYTADHKLLWIYLRVAFWVGTSASVFLIMSRKRLGAGILLVLQRNPAFFLLVLVSLGPAYFQFVQLGVRLAGSIILILICSCLLLSEPPLISLLARKRLRLFWLLVRSVRTFYWAAIVAFIVAFTRFIVVPLYAVGVPLLTVAVALRTFRIVSFKNYVLLVFDLFVLMTVLLLKASFWDVALSQIDEPPYLEPLIVCGKGTLMCQDRKYNVENGPVWMRKVNLYKNETVITATNGHEFRGPGGHSIAGIVLDRSNRTCGVRWFYETYCHDMIYDEDKARYFVSRLYQQEVLTMDENLSIINRVKLPEQIVDLFLDTTASGRKRLLALSFLHGSLYVLDPDTLRLESSRTYAFSIQNYNFGKIHPRKRFLCASVIRLPYVAGVIDLEGEKGTRFGVPGLGSWGIDVDPDADVFYVSEFFFGYVFKVDSTSMRVVKWTYLRPGIRSVVFDSKRKLIYVGDYYFKDIFVLDQDLNKVGILRSNGRVTLMRLSKDCDSLYTVGWRGVFRVDLQSALSMMERVRAD
jgi:hypothetical protein